MSSKWPRVKTGDVFDLINGFAFKSKEFLEAGAPVLKIKNVKAGALNLDNLAFVDPEFLSKKPDKIVCNNDLLITMSGNRHDGSMETWVGKVCWFGIDSPYLVNQRVGILRLKKAVDANARFLAYQLSSEERQRHFIAVATSSGGQANLSPSQINSTELQLPPREVQDWIVSIVGRLEDKIQLNHQINQTLEQMAQAIFKSWFVDFEPVKAKIAALEAGGSAEDALLAAMQAISGKNEAQLNHLQKEQTEQYAKLRAIAELFPSAMQESELGEIPEGWEVQRVGNILELVYGKALKSTHRKEGTVPVYGSGGITGYHNEALVPKGSIIVGRKGTVGSLYWEDEAFFPIDTTYYVQPRTVPLTYCYYAMQTLGLEKMNTDAAVPGLNRENVYRLELARPDSSVLQKFNAVVSTMRKAIHANLNSSKALAEFRDILLPKLLSGELQLPEAEVQIQEAADAV